MTMSAGTSQPRASRRIIALALSVSLAAIVVTFVVATQTYLTAEAWLASRWVSAVVPGGSSFDPADGAFYFGLGGKYPAGLRVSSGCSAFVLALPLFAAAAIAAYFDRFPVRRVVAALLATTALLVLANQVRLVMIAWADSRWRREGIFWSHTVFGSVLSLIGVVGALIVFYLIIRGRRRRDEA
ncbi:exosortase/archaeosortase family protein [Amycolatopsis sp. AA4]|uniref:archaeosortase/exosortase family protein n=1 Tax=Actinomycetes TaxID=1760 RepID=UPI0001DEE7BC|nr:MULTISPECIES: archaeosortase/exosortase family protein [Actinomycetes]ATY13966.1 exosortase/archaeosortase family protein [Amycolatopsis sp. AA4]EFL09985.1 predicted protein [Streptomyces sp. AA4]